MMEHLSHSLMPKICKKTLHFAIRIRYLINGVESAIKNLYFSKNIYTKLKKYRLEKWQK